MLFVIIFYITAWNCPTGCCMQAEELHSCAGNGIVMVVFYNQLPWCSLNHTLSNESWPSPFWFQIGTDTGFGYVGPGVYIPETTLSSSEFHLMANRNSCCQRFPSNCKFGLLKLLIWLALFVLSKTWHSTVLSYFKSELLWRGIWGNNVHTPMTRHDSDPETFWLQS